MQKLYRLYIYFADFTPFRLFGMVIEKLFMAEVQKVSGTTERKICAVGITKILCEAPVMVGGDYQAMWFVYLFVFFLSLLVNT